jgi:hypothetical protein
LNSLFATTLGLLRLEHVLPAYPFLHSQKPLLSQKPPFSHFKESPALQPRSLKINKTVIILRIQKDLLNYLRILHDEQVTPPNSGLQRQVPFGAQIPLFSQDHRMSLHPRTFKSIFRF